MSRMINKLLRETMEMTDTLKIRNIASHVFLIWIESSLSLFLPWDIECNKSLKSTLLELVDISIPCGRNSNVKYDYIEAEVVYMLYVITKPMNIVVLTGALENENDAMSCERIKGHCKEKTKCRSHQSHALNTIVLSLKFDVDGRFTILPIASSLISFSLSNGLNYIPVTRSWSSRSALCSSKIEIAIVFLQNWEIFIIFLKFIFWSL